MKKNPLKIPEIVIHVGKFVPLWILHQSCEGSKYLFRPQDLLACCLVSKMWRDAMLPTLWHMYDAKSRMFSRHRIPSEVLSRYAHLFQIVNIPENNYGHNHHQNDNQNDNGPRAGNRAHLDIDIHAAHIRELTMGSDRFLYNYNLSSPRMRLLDIRADGGSNYTNGDYQQDDYIPTNPVHAIVRLWSLEYLSLRKYVFQHVEFEAMLRLKPYLKTLELYAIHILDPPPPIPVPPSYSQVPMFLRRPFLSPPLLRTVTHLRLEYCDFKESTLVALFWAVPLLESLAWLISKSNIGGFESAAVAREIRQYCPRLGSLHLGILFHGQESDQHFVNLVTSGHTKVLQRISLATNQLWPLTEQALLARRDNLTHLSITFRRRLNQYDTLPNLLAKMSQLQVFKVSGRRNDMGFTSYLRRQIKTGAQGMSWMDRRLADEITNTVGDAVRITRLVPAEWSLRGYPRVDKHGRELFIHLFDIWLLERARTMTYMQEVHVNASEYVRNH